MELKQEMTAACFTDINIFLDNKSLLKVNSNRDLIQDEAKIFRVLMFCDFVVFFTIHWQNVFTQNFTPLRRQKLKRKQEFHNLDNLNFAAGEHETTLKEQRILVNFLFLEHDHKVAMTLAGYVT